MMRMMTKVTDGIDLGVFPPFALASGGFFRSVMLKTIHVYHPLGNSKSVKIVFEMLLNLTA